MQPLLKKEHGNGQMLIKMLFKVVIDDEEPDPDFDNVYTITWLNDNNLVYVATIKHSENGCSAAVNVYIQFTKE